MRSATRKVNTLDTKISLQTVQSNMGSNALYSQYREVYKHYIHCAQFVFTILYMMRTFESKCGRLLLLDASPLPLAEIF